MRADAVANRRRILGAAEEVFTERGTGASTEEVARRAGVGVGTVFRHFPTKNDLVEAALVAHLDDLAEHAGSLTAAGDPTAALQALLREMVRTGRAKMAMARHLLGDGPGSGSDPAGGPGGSADPNSAELPSAAAEASGRLRAVVAGMLHAAQAAGEIRADVDVDVVYFLLRGLSQAQDTLPVDDATRRRAVDIVLEGLAAGQPGRRNR